MDLGVEQNVPALPIDTSSIVMSQYTVGMSSAGQANEAGSVFRRDAAVYFAVFALIGKPIDRLNQTARVQRLEFETSDPTDDIVLSLDDGTKAFISAKNHVDAGKSFKDTVAGWVAQVKGGMGPNDLLGLSFGSCAGWVHDLAGALHRLRLGQEILRRVELLALQKLDALVPEEYRDEIRERARLVQISDSSISGDTKAMLEVLLSGIIEGDTTLAIAVLSSMLHTLAGEALVADVPALVRQIDATAGLMVRPAADSPAGAEAASIAALSSYLEGFTSRRGRVNLPLLADDLEPVVIKGLYSSIQVIDASHAEGRRPEEDLAPLIRRRRRILLVGQPGSGKSVATWEIAASCAEDVDAPIPVRVHLPDLLPIVRFRDLVISDIIEAGVRSAQESIRPLLVSRLTKAALTGDVMLLLDGLDECRADAATMAENLRRLIEHLHPKAGLVVATRASAEVPAQRLGLGRLDLVRPADLNSTMDAVLVECGRVRVPETQREEWLAARRSCVRDVQTAQRGLVEAPQLALLVVLIVAESSEMNVPRERAKLLHTAVLRSVQRWELTRFKVPGMEWAGDLTPNMLLDGFQVLGQLLDTDDTRVWDDAVSAIAVMLSSDRWGIALGRAEELAIQVLRFWDEHVSVFTLDEASTLTSRSRVFTEVATAMWTKTCSVAELETWATSALRFRDSEGVLGLAQGLNPLLVQTLLDMGSENPESPLAIASAVASGIISPTMEDLQLLSTQLMEHITAIDSGELELVERQSRRDDSLGSILGDRRGGTSWPLVEALCALPLHDLARKERREFVASLPDARVLNAWVALVEAAEDDRELTESERDIVQAAIDIDIPDVGPPIHTSRRRITLPSGPSVPKGIGSVALLAVRHLAQLSVTTPKQIYRISTRAPKGQHDAIERALRNAGVDTLPRHGLSAFTGLMSALRDDDHELRLLEQIAELDASRDIATLDKSDKWSLKDVGDLIFASGYLSVGVGDFRTAFVADSPEVRRDWLGCVATAYRIDVAAAAAQARYIIDANRYKEDWRVLTVQPAYKVKAIRTNALGSDEQIKLLGALEAVSDWIAWSAANILAQTTPRWDTNQLFNADRSKWKPRRALLFPLVAILASEDGESLLKKAANSADPTFRQAAELAIISNEALDPDGNIARMLSIDEDLTVRGSLDAGDPPPLRWSCNDCGTVNDIEAVDCPGCEEGTRPSREKASKKRR